MTPLQVLKKARSLLVKVGWVQHQSVCHSDSGKALGYCAIGAIDAATATTQNGFTESLKLFRQVIDRRRRGHIGIATWNDRPSRRKAHVLKKFDQAIALAKAAR